MASSTSNDFVNDQVLAAWEAIRLHVEGMELDVSKNVKGNAAAGVRVRRSTRELRTLCTQLIRATLAGREAAHEALEARRAAKRALAETAEVSA